MRVSSLEEQLIREELPEYVQRQRELKSVVLLYMRDTLYSQHFEYGSNYSHVAFGNYTLSGKKKNKVMIVM